MEWAYPGGRLSLVQGDITKQAVDAVVNAANGTLLGGGGVDGAIHQAAGPDLLACCRRIRKEQWNGALLPTGTPVITPGFRLPARYVIHVVGPICGSDPDPAGHLRDAYWNSLALAAHHGLSSIAFPSISTGAYGCDIHWASEIALRTTMHFQRAHSMPEVRMVLHSDADFHAYSASLKENGRADSTN